MQIKSKERVKINGEVFTREIEVIEMLNLLPLENFSKNIFEPACGTGNFLVEILKKKLEILNEEIATKTLFGMDICPDNIHTSKERLKELVISETAKKNIEKNIFLQNFFDFKPNEKVEIIITNPPYQTNTEGHANQATPLYNKFFFKAKEFNPEIILMIIPSRWMSGGWGLDSFREEMKKGNVSFLKNYTNSKIPFPENEIKGGICYFLWKKEYSGTTTFLNINENNEQTIRNINLKKYDVIIKDEISENILDKINTEDNFSEFVKGLNYFGLPTNFKGNEKGKYKVFLKYKQYTYTDIIKNEKDADKYKVVISKASENGKYPGKIISKPIILEPNEVCSMSFLVVYIGNKEEAEKIKTYLERKDIRFLISLRKNTQDISKEKFVFVPKNIKENLLNEKEKEFINNKIKDF